MKAKTSIAQGLLLLLIGLALLVLNYYLFKMNDLGIHLIAFSALAFAGVCADNHKEHRHIVSFFLGLFSAFFVSVSQHSVSIMFYTNELKFWIAIVRLCIILHIACYGGMLIAQGINKILRSNDKFGELIAQLIDAANERPLLITEVQETASALQSMHQAQVQRSDTDSDECIKEIAPLALKLIDCTTRLQANDEKHKELSEKIVSRYEDILSMQTN